MPRPWTESYGSLREFLDLHPEYLANVIDTMIFAFRWLALLKKAGISDSEAIVGKLTVIWYDDLREGNSKFLPHPALDLIRPDEIAECWDAVPKSIYKKLWGLVKEYDSRLSQMEYPPEPDLFSVTRYWDKLDRKTQRHLNVIAEINNPS